jgi:hypothetical protein
MVKDPVWAQGLAQSGKSLNYASLTEKVFDKLNIGIEMKDVLEEMPQPMMNPLAPEMNPMEQLNPQAQIPQNMMPPMPMQNGQPTGQPGGI